MRQLRPGAGEPGDSSAAFRARLHLFSLFTLLWVIVAATSGFAGVRAVSPAVARSIDPDHIEVVSEQETGSPSRNPNALATLALHGSELAIRHDKARNGGGGLVPHSTGQRSLKDFEVEDWVLVATMDGGLMARERKTGMPRWNFTTDEPVVQTIDHRANVSAEARDRTNLPTWIVGPSDNGELYQYTSIYGLEKTDFTIKDVVELSPYSPAEFDEVYIGEKKTTLYAVDPDLGTVTQYFGTGGVYGNILRKNCTPRSGPHQPECEVPEKPERDEKPKVMIARTEYTISIHSKSTGELLWTIKYNQWGPNNSDRDLLAQYERSIDDRYILSRHDGVIYGFDDSIESPDDKPSWQHDISSQVVATFDVVRSLRHPEAGVLVLNQPVAPKVGATDGLAAYVGCTSEGGFFAMSETRFPLVTSGSEQAKCYRENLDNWPRLDIPQRQKLLVGKHSVRYTAALEPYLPSIDAPSDYNTGDGKGQRYNDNSLPPFSQPTLSEKLHTVVLKAKDPIAVVTAILFLVGAMLATPRGQGFLRDHLVHGEISSNRVSDVVVVNAPPDAPGASSAPSAPFVQGLSLPEDGLPVSDAEAEKAKKPVVKFAEQAQLDTVMESEEQNGTTPKKKKAHRGKRGGAARKKINSAKESPELSPESGSKEIPSVTQVGTSLTLVSNGELRQELPDSNHVILNNLTIYMNKVLGTGSQGTIVYEGMWEGKPVAVKQIPTVFMDVAEHEVKLLQESDFHPNVVRYYCRQQQLNNIYIALEKCPGSLYDLFSSKVELDQFKRLRRELDKDVRDGLLQITKGLDHLHSIKVIHRDIKPQNILVGAPNYPNPKDPTSYRPRMLISDFGLCKKLQTDEYSFGVTTAHNAGTVGWRAPELLRETDARTQSRPADQESCGTGGTGSGTEVIVDSHTKRRATKAIDIFALGCVFYFVLSNGAHPFGDRVYREYNIIQGKSDLSLLDDFADDGVFEARDLISSMIQKNPKQRPETRMVAMHPFFWSPAKSLEFLTDVSDHFEAEKDHEKNDPAYASPYIPLLEAGQEMVLGGEWIGQMERHFYAELFATKRRGYDGTKMLDLLRAIRNKKNHYQDMAPEAQAAVGPLPQGYLSYFTGRFPRLLMHTYNAVRQAGFDAEPRFHRYFTLSSW